MHARTPRSPLFPFTPPSPPPQTEHVLSTSLPVPQPHPATHPCTYTCSPISRHNIQHATPCVYAGNGCKRVFSLSLPAPLTQTDQLLSSSLPQPPPHPATHPC